VPKAQFNILFIPYDISADTLLPALVALDTAGLIYGMFRPAVLGEPLEPVCLA
jgi:hypothetical protein